MKNPNVSNSFDSLLSIFQSSNISIKLCSCSLSSEKRFIWFAVLFSKVFLDFKIILGIELYKDCLFLNNLSNAPDFPKPSSCSLLISFGLTLLIKSEIFLNLPFFSLSLTTLDIASYPTFLIAPRE